MHQVVAVDEQINVGSCDDFASVKSFALVVASSIQDTSRRICRAADDAVNSSLFVQAERLHLLRGAMRPKYLPPIVTIAIVVCCALISGCSLMTRRYAGPAQNGAPVAMPNPMVIPVSDVDFAWRQLVDMVDDYFEIASEQQVREIGGVLMDGRITTRPLTGATCIEPLRRDAVGLYERLHGTFQSVRRTAHMRVMPVASGFQIQLEVLKELEDVSQPEYSTVTSAVRRHDGSLIANNGLNRELGPGTLGWISLGRDEALEQEMLRNLHARLFNAELVPQPPLR